MPSESASVNPQELVYTLTDIHCPPRNFTILDVKPVRLQDLACLGQYLVWARPVLIHSSGRGIDDVAVSVLLNIQADLVVLARDGEERAMGGMNDGVDTDVREVRVRDHINDSPDGVYIK